MVHVVVTSVLLSSETATTDPWRKLFKNGRIVMVAVDEAHCISEWLVCDVMIMHA